MHIYHIIALKFLKDCNERFHVAFFIFRSILVFWKRNSECYSNWNEKPTNVESRWNLPKLYVSKALGLLNKNLVILGAPKSCNCLLATWKVCFQVHDSESHKPAFSSTLLNCRSLKATENGWMYHVFVEAMSLLLLLFKATEKGLMYHVSVDRVNVSCIY